MGSSVCLFIFLLCFCENLGAKIFTALSRYLSIDAFISKQKRIYTDTYGLESLFSQARNLGVKTSLQGKLLIPFLGNTRETCSVYSHVSSKGVGNG